MINSVVLVGRLTRDPELRYTPSGAATATFTIAVPRKYKAEGKDREVDFIPVVTWKAQAENCAKYTKKGSLVAVEGRLQIRNWEDKEGQRRTTAEVHADSVQFLDSKGRDTERMREMGEDDL